MKQYMLFKVSQGKFHTWERHTSDGCYVCGVQSYGDRIRPGSHAELNKLFYSHEMCKRCRAKIEKLGVPAKLILVR